MVAQKRALEEAPTNQKAKKSRINQTGKSKADPVSQSEPSRLISAEDIDFPRGGGTSFTPLEVKTIRAEGVKEANEELFQDSESPLKSRRRKTKNEKVASRAESKSDKIRIEHLNYKKINMGMKIMGQIIGILPLALLVSLPNQLFAHVPITNISVQYTKLLERIGEDPDEVVDTDDEDEENRAGNNVPDLAQMFSVGQYVRAVVSGTHTTGSSDTSGLNKSRDEVARSCRRLELTLEPSRVNEGVQKRDLQSGFTLTAAVSSVEDHGYILDLGIPDADGFLSFDSQSSDEPKLHVGHLVNVTVVKMSMNKRICKVTSSTLTFSSSIISEASSANSVLPGSLVQGLVTGVHADGLNVQILGFFDGTVDRLHLNHNNKIPQVGKHVKARVLYGYHSAPPRFALALADHITSLTICQAGLGKFSEIKRSIQDVYPLGSILDAVKVARIETERGLFVEVAPGLEGFIHISHLSDDHVPVLDSSSPWKVGSVHRARVTGYQTFDGLLQLSFKPTIINQLFFQVTDLQAGEIVKGAIKRLSDSALFVSLSGNIDGVVWPNHYADITLKHPARRFKPGANIKCRVLVVDAERKRISLTAKKTLVESTLPILTKFEDVHPGIVAHAVVFKVHDKHLMVEFYNNLKAIVFAKEANEFPGIKLSNLYPIGKVVRVRVLSADPDQMRIVASIRQASASQKSVADISAVEVGNTVTGCVSEIHTEHVIITLEPTQIKALLSLKNLANHRKLSLALLHASLKVGDTLEELVVVTRNPDKGIVLVANKPIPRPALPAKGATLTLENVSVGQHVGGRVTRHTHHGTLIKINSHIGGTLHPTDTTDNYDIGTAFPPIDSIIKAAVIEIDKDKRQVTLSTRHSRLRVDQSLKIVDREINNVSDLQVGESVRGYIKNVAEHGLFVTIGRRIDARVQIRELFDEFIKDWKPHFQTNQLVKGRILSIEPENKKVELTFKSGDLPRKSSHITAADVREGQKINGVIKRIEVYGLFIDIEGSRLHGLCHKSQLSDNPDADVAEALHGFRVGDRVKAIVIGAENGRISFSLKPSQFSEEDFDGHGQISDVEMLPSDSYGVVKDDTDVDRHSHTSVGADDEEEISNSTDNDEELPVHVDLNDPNLAHQQQDDAETSRHETFGGPLTLSGAFDWFGDKESNNQDDDTPSSGSSDEGGEPSKKKKRKRKEIEKDLTADMHTKMPESNTDFERLLLGSPNSSYIWIQYMSFQLQVSEIDKAREIARRAIKAINFREEQERLNIWIGLLNLENVYGADDSLEATFKEATQANDSKTMHLRLASIFDQSGKSEKAEEQFKRTCKKFGKSSKVWALFGEFCLKAGNVEGARNLLPRSLQSLEKRKHLKTISRFAQLEYKHGDPERGRTLFEGIVDSHPKRWDLWSIYIDMEAGQKNIQSLRNLFDRVLALKMTSHKAKSFFKKWLELEKRIGDEEGVDVVKAKAFEWTQRASNGS